MARICRKSETGNGSKCKFGDVFFLKRTRPQINSGCPRFGKPCPFFTSYLYLLTSSL